MPELNASKRLLSLDALRGITIALMIVVNNPGSWSHLYWPLAHAEWHGITITDFVFPFFVFIVGVSIVLATNNQLAKGVSGSALRKKVIIRSIKIFIVGILLSKFPNYLDLSEIRIPGVLQRIALVYLACALWYLKSSGWKSDLKLFGALLIGYWLAMAFIPVPEFGAGMLEPGKNLANWLDSILIPGKMWQGTWDPEGLLSTLPAIATGLSGILVGQLWISKLEQNEKLVWLFFVGLASVVAGLACDLFFPINKSLWTSSFVLYTSGWASMGFAACIWLIDIKGYKKWAQFGIIYGSNAITIYALSGMLAVLFGGNYTGIKSAVMEILNALPIHANLASFVYAILYMLFCFIPAYILHKKKIFIKL